MHIEEIENNSKRTQKYGVEDVKGTDAYNEILLLNDPSTNPIEKVIMFINKEVILLQNDYGLTSTMMKNLRQSK
jgi:hypothetical protein